MASRRRLESTDRVEYLDRSAHRPRAPERVCGTISVRGCVERIRSRESATLATLRRFARTGWIDRGRESPAVIASFDRMGHMSGRESALQSLSDGNQQRVVLSKWLTANSDLLIVDEPTRGVDAGAKAELHAWIDPRASEGAAILLISNELPQRRSLSTRECDAGHGLTPGGRRRRRWFGSGTSSRYPRNA